MSALLLIIAGVALTLAAEAVWMVWATANWPRTMRIVTGAYKLSRPVARMRIDLYYRTRVMREWIGAKWDNALALAYGRPELHSQAGATPIPEMDHTCRIVEPQRSQHAYEVTQPEHDALVGDAMQRIIDYDNDTAQGRTPLESEQS